MTPVSLSIIIVNFNTKDLLRECLSSVEKADKEGLSIEIIVVDNASGDGSVDMVKKEFPSTKVIQNKDNIGFGKANNIGIKQATGRYILLLNSDTEINSDCLVTTVQFMEKNKNVGVSTCKLLLPNGNIDPACHRGFPTPWAALTYFSGLERVFPKIKIFSGYHLWHKGISTIHEIDSPSGAFFLVRKEVIEEVGAFDEDFFMYGEDLDLAYRIKSAGFTIVYNPTVITLHKKKQSGRENENILLRRKTQQYFYETMKLFYRKHYEKQYPWIVTRCIYFFVDCKIFLLHHI
jgi:GT2 family glycosyltransferase